jgi:hypothetical protein
MGLRFRWFEDCYSLRISKTDYLRVDPSTNANLFLRGRTDQSGRYASWDHCFNYFRNAYDEKRLDSLTSGEELQNSCLHLGFYLASWGMYRGKSLLLKQSAYALAPLVEVIASAPPDLWDLDVENYNEDSYVLMLDWSEEVRTALSSKSTDTLVTKAMLGIFGNVPAFDRYFRAGFDSFSLNKASLRKVKTYFERYADDIESLRKPTIDFAGNETKYRYTQAKVIDMIFFVAGGGIASKSASAE